MDKATDELNLSVGESKLKDQKIQELTEMVENLQATNEAQALEIDEFDTKLDERCKVIKQLIDGEVIVFGEPFMHDKKMKHFLNMSMTLQDKITKTRGSTGPMDMDFSSESHLSSIQVAQSGSSETMDSRSRSIGTDDTTPTDGDSKPKAVDNPKPTYADAASSRMSAGMQPDSAEGFLGQFPSMSDDWAPTYAVASPDKMEVEPTSAPTSPSELTNAGSKDAGSTDMEQGNESGNQAAEDGTSTATPSSGSAVLETDVTW